MKIRRHLLSLLFGFCFASVPRLLPGLWAQIPPVLIATIQFEGNRSLSALQLRSLLRISQEGREYSAENLISDLQRVERAYRDEGFLNARVGPPEVKIQALGENKGAVVRIPVTEGPRYSVGQLAVKGAQVLPPSTLMQMCPLQKGQPYSRIKISQWQMKIEETYREIGYLRVRCIAHEDLSGAGKTANCTLDCVEGTQYSVAKIAVVGDASVDPLQFKRRLLLSEGGIFNPEMLVLSIQFLNQMDLYKPISNSDVTIDIDDAKGTVDLTWHLFRK
jgi:outer membrane protein insertion porin family